MCGLIGMISKKASGFSYRASEIFTQLLYTNALRGQDSTGVFGVTEEGNVNLLKSAQASYNFIQDKEYKYFTDDIYSKYHIVVGHNRAATRGISSDENAHPFISDHICLVHNGTLVKHKHLADTTVDSEAICKSIATRNYEKTIPEIDGSFALIWYDAKQKILYLSRNSERPLWMLDTPDVIFLASEPAMLSWIVGRNYKQLTTKPAYFKEDHIYSWKLHQTEDVFTIEASPPKKAKPELNGSSRSLRQTLEKIPKKLLGTGCSHSQGSSKYNYGDSVLFEQLSNSVYNGKVTIRGVCFDDPSIAVCGELLTDNLSLQELENLLDNTDYFIGTVSGFSIKNGSETLIVKDIIEKEVFYTCNDKILTEEQIAEAGYCCHECGSVIDIDEQNGLFWARTKNNSVVKLLCNECITNKQSKGSLHVL